ncbi:MAG: hypothetical protein BIFFINMI_03132 [Phycisphaerae bacterium]|nr:hypothetical protein [Phycisphaerae bacterium]
MDTARQRKLGRAGLLVAVGGLCVAWSVGLGASPTTAPDAARKPDTKTATCTNQTCHATLISRKVTHGPTAQNKCDACHVYDEPREHTFKLSAPADKLCDNCHTLKQRTVVHTPVKMAQCTGCHDPHGSDNRTLLKADPTRGLCESCHKKDAFMNRKFLHGPVAAGACILCHEPHSSWEPKLLIKPKDQLCVTCHADVVKKAEAARFVHEPVKKDCGQCHDPHSGDAKYQLKEAPPKLCLGCHADVRKQLTDAKVIHGQAPPQKNEDGMPKVDAAAHRAQEEAFGCLGCHSAHVSTLPKLQKAAQPDLCLSCHNQTLIAADGSKLTNMAALLKDNPEHHGPIREGSCTACHQPHGAGTFRLLSHEYPQQFYAPFKLESYALCFDCHIPQLVLAEKGTGLTRFRNGDINLHWLHVNREKGRTCRACHEVHASKRPFHIRDAVPFGDSGWMLEIRFEQTTTGGSCAPGCHQKRTYDRGQENLGPPKPGGLK